MDIETNGYQGIYLIPRFQRGLVFMNKELPACPVETTLSLISDRWKVLIIRDLLGGSIRFSELK